MSKDLYNRFTHIKSIIEEKENQRTDLKVLAKAELVNEFLDSECNNRISEDIIESSRKRYNFELNSNVTEYDISQLLKQIKAEYDDDRLKLLIEDCKISVLDSIIKPFGIAGIIFEDKIGGNVDTINNVRKGIYATDENKIRYENREGYDYKEYHDHNENYKKHKENIMRAKENNETINDAYTNLEINNDNIVSIEHIVSASDISNDPAVSLARGNGNEIANSDSNLCYINGQLNSSIKKDSPKEYIDKLNSLSNPEARQNMLNYLNSKTTPLSDEEEKHKKLIEQKNAMVENKENVLNIDKKAKDDIKKKLNSKYYKSQEFKVNLAKTSAKEGTKMGMQQALGIMMREFTLATFTEMEDIFSKRNAIIINSAFFNSLKQRFEKIAIRVMSKWKDVVKAFGSGYISGFFSNITTVIINVFFTTSKKITRIIREGLYSLLKALKILFYPPINMSKEEAAHEATKLIASGLVITGGVASEEILEKALLSIPGMAIFSPIIAPVVMGIVTGLSMALITYIIDTIDLFKVNANKKSEYISNHLNTMIDENIEEIDDVYNYIINRVGL